MMDNNVCPNCGAELSFRLGSYQCSTCGYDRFSDSTDSPTLAKESLHQEQPFADHDLTLKGQTEPDSVEKYYLFIAGLGMYLGGIAWVSLADGWISSSMGLSRLLMMWPWLLYFVIGAITGVVSGTAISTLIVAACQSLIVFSDRLWLKYLAGALATIFMLWNAFVTLVMIFNPVYFGFTGSTNWWIFPVAFCVSAWAILFLIRDISRIRQRSEAGSPQF